MKRLLITIFVLTSLTLNANQPEGWVDRNPGTAHLMIAVAAAALASASCLYMALTSHRDERYLNFAAAALGTLSLGAGVARQAYIPLEPQLILSSVILGFLSTLSGLAASGWVLIENYEEHLKIGAAVTIGIYVLPHVILATKLALRRMRVQPENVELMD